MIALVFRHTMAGNYSFLNWFSDILYWKPSLSVIPRSSAITRHAKASVRLREFLSPIIKKNQGLHDIVIWSGALDRSAILTADEEKRHVRFFNLSRASIIQTKTW